MTENELKEIEKEIDKLPRSWFFHDMAMALVSEIKRLKDEKREDGVALRYRAKSADGNTWVYGEYECIEGHHVIHDENGQNYPSVIVYSTLEKVV